MPDPQDFLNGVCTNIINMHQKQLKTYNGERSSSAAGGKGGGGGSGGWLYFKAWVAAPLACVHHATFTAHTHMHTPQYTHAV